MTQNFNQPVISEAIINDLIKKICETFKEAIDELTTRAKEFESLQPSQNDSALQQLVSKMKVIFATLPSWQHCLKEFHENRENLQKLQSIQSEIQAIADKQIQEKTQINVSFDIGGGPFTVEIFERENSPPPVYDPAASIGVPLGTIPSEEDFNIIVNLITLYANDFIFVKKKDESKPFYTLEKGEEINENNANLMFDEEKFGKIPQQKQQILRQIIKPYMYSPRDNTWTAKVFKVNGEEKLYAHMRCVSFLQNSNPGATHYGIMISEIRYRELPNRILKTLNQIEKYKEIENSLVSKAPSMSNFLSEYIKLLSSKSGENS